MKLNIVTVCFVKILLVYIIILIHLEAPAVEVSDLPTSGKIDLLMCIFFQIIPN